MITMAQHLQLKELAAQWRQRMKTPEPPRKVFRKLVEEDAPITCYDKEAIRCVRCENCAKVLPYGTKPCFQKDDADAPSVYLCRYCKSGHEEKLDQEPIEPGKGWGAPKPPQRICDSIVLYHADGKRVKDVLIGCQQKTSDWDEYGTRVLLHLPGCKVHREAMRALLSRTDAAGPAELK